MTRTDWLTLLLPSAQLANLKLYIALKTVMPNRQTQPLFAFIVVSHFGTAFGVISRIPIQMMKIAFVASVVYHRDKELTGLSGN